MGALCGKQESDAFSRPGRTVGSAAPASGTAPLPGAAVKKNVGAPPRTLGGSGGAPGSGAQDARQRAAAAAEVDTYYRTVHEAPQGSGELTIVTGAGSSCRSTAHWQAGKSGGVTEEAVEIRNSEASQRVGEEATGD
jgi:hypothetical protein